MSPNRHTLVDPSDPNSPTLGDDSEATRYERHVALLIEIPVIYTADLDGLREYREHFECESEWLLNCIQTGGPVRLRLEIMGEKDSEVAEVWGDIREAQLVEPGWAGALTDERLREHGQHRLLRDERACEWCMTGVDALKDADDHG